jgi:pimeloyl-ACP methyl ester carboxylesterase
MGFMADLHQASAAGTLYRERVLRSVSCPTLVTASRHDGGVAFVHAADFLRIIPRVRLVDTGAPSHFFWLGPARQTVSDAIRAFMAESAPADSCPGPTEPAEGPGPAAPPES